MIFRLPKCSFRQPENREGINFRLPFVLCKGSLKTMIRLLRKLFQKPQIIIKKQPQIIHAIA